jgi:hypothetical protein
MLNTENGCGADLLEYNSASSSASSAVVPLQSQIPRRL